MNPRIPEDWLIFGLDLVPEMNNEERLQRSVRYGIIPVIKCIYAMSPDNVRLLPD